MKIRLPLSNIAANTALLSIVTKRCLFFRFVVVICASLTAAWAADRPKVVLVCGDFEYLTNLTFPALKQYLEKNFDLDVVYLERTVGEVVAREKTTGEEIGGLDALENADLLVLGIRRTALPAEQLNRFKTFFNAGRAVIGVRTTSHAFENWKTFDREVLGGHYQGYHLVPPGTSFAAQVAGGGERHPILRGVLATFPAGGVLYKSSPLGPATTVLVTGTMPNGPAEPVAWTHTYKGSRIFYTALGDFKDYYQQPYMQMLVNAIFWGLDRPVPASGRHAPGFPLLSPKQLSLDLFRYVALHPKFTILDVRSAAEYAGGHVPRAMSVELGAPGFEKAVARLNKNEPHIVYGRRGHDSASAAKKLHETGFKFVYDFAGGFSAWQTGGNPVER